MYADSRERSLRRKKGSPEIKLRKKKGRTAGGEKTFSESGKKKEAAA